MFNSLRLDAKGDPELTKRYTNGVKLAMRLCEHTPGQFKLIETPINSFLLITNIMPEDDRPWQHHLDAAGVDFSGLHLPRLQALDALLGAARNPGASTGQPGHEPPGSRPDTPETPKSPLPPSGADGRPRAIAYLCYDSPTWSRALCMNKDAIINEAIGALAVPSHWQGVIVKDPLPWLWLLFYGKRSFCREEQCMYLERHYQPGPILLPPALYNPLHNVTSFMAQVCTIVKFLYGGCVRLPDVADAEDLPFDPSRVCHVLNILYQVEDGPAYIANRCLLCDLKRQNAMSGKIGSDVGRCLILQEDDEKYITPQIGKSRCTFTGDVFLWPTYDLGKLLDRIEAHGLF
ncbi:protein UL95 [Common bottlenose dolphin gammaherpesvirus 1 strain Sarasota]|uniref:Protein UL95 n=1 Tax=Common bottlenose dolphin gammaherpesvirus 1 strain Sarasota TaxID=2022783 RepID=A0A1Z1NE18_9GAMA|nr:protein UL95 [Common bottlenose dolphin gammaherpesvirus 1 strain Sarasota]ARW78097.1 protein UL95 [Common bottlenose dolphin gammaherpesvirus 1 strain Sarasota]